MEGLSMIHSSLIAPASMAMSNGSDRPQVSIEGKGVIEPGKDAYYRVKTNAVNPTIKWTISTPELNLITADTPVIKVRPTKEGSLNLTVNVKGADGRWNEVVWTVLVRKK